MKNYDYNSIKNQDIKRKFVQRDVLACVSGLMEYVLKSSYESKDPFLSFEDIQNYYAYTDYHGNTLTSKQRDEELERLNEEIDEIDGELEELGERWGDEEDFIYLLPDSGVQKKAEELHKKLDELKRDLEHLEEVDSEPQEIYEWWIVTKWLGEKLKDKGEPVMEDGMNWYWDEVALDRLFFWIG